VQAVVQSFLGAGAETGIGVELVGRLQVLEERSVRGRDVEMRVGLRHLFGDFDGVLG
jgi:hypothetical protein